MPTGDRDLDALLAAAGAPALAEEQDERALAAVLAAFNAAGSVELAASGAARGRPARSRRHTVTLVARCAAALFAVTGGGVAVASAGILPEPIQSLAHHVFGGIGVPAPKIGGTTRGTEALPSPTAVSAGQPGHVSATPTPEPTIAATSAPSGPWNSPAQSTTTLVNLCGRVVAHGDAWQSAVSEQDRAVLTAAAGNDKVPAYCAQLLDASHDGDQPSAAPPSTPAGGSGGGSSDSDSPTIATTPGKGNGNGNGNGNGGAGGSGGIGNGGGGVNRGGAIHGSGVRHGAEGGIGNGNSDSSGVSGIRGISGSSSDSAGSNGVSGSDSSCGTGSSGDSVGTGGAANGAGAAGNGQPVSSAHAAKSSS